jgi:hypothetical protein
MTTTNKNWKNPEQHEAYKLRQRLYAAKQRAVPGFARAQKLWYKYGLTLETFEQLFASQGYKCALCGKGLSLDDPKNKAVYPFVDHNHETGKVRGILCCSCNFAVGQIGDTVLAFEHAISYLRGAL